MALVPGQLFPFWEPPPGFKRRDPGAGLLGSCEDGVSGGAVRTPSAQGLPVRAALVRTW